MSNHLDPLAPNVPVLNPCGCGGAGHWNPKEHKPGDYDWELGYVECLQCGMRTGGAMSRDNATQVWNRSHLMSDLVGHLKAVASDSDLSDRSKLIRSIALLNSTFGPIGLVLPHPDALIPR
jgi:hypothetical protein